MDATEFHITLPSTTSLEEIPHNTSNHYKVRLPQPLRLTGSAWRVGLTDISLPDTNVSLQKLVCDVHDLVYPKEGETQIEARHHELGRHPGHKRTGWRTVYENHGGPPREKGTEHGETKTRKINPLLTSVDVQNLSMTIRWVPHGSDTDMLIDNRHTYIQRTQNNPETHFDLPLALSDNPTDVEIYFIFSGF